MKRSFTRPAVRSIRPDTLCPRARIFHFSVEKLEDRIAPSGAVAATLNHGVLTITGDEGSNDIVISIDPAAVIIVGNNGTLVGGQTSLALTGAVTSLAVAMHDGNDKVSIGASQDFKVPKSAVFDMGDGDDSLDLTTDAQLQLGSFTVKAGNGTHTVLVDGGQNSGILGAATFQYGNGSSGTQLYDMQVKGTIKVNAGLGADHIQLTNITGTTLMAMLGPGGAPGNLSELTLTDSPLTSVQATHGPGGSPFNVGILGTVNGSVKIKSSTDVQLSIDDATITGAVSISAGSAGVKVKSSGSASTIDSLVVGGGSISFDVPTGISLTVTHDTKLTGRNVAATVEGTFVTANLSLIGNAAYGVASFTQTGAAASTTINGNLLARGEFASVDIGTVFPNIVEGGAFHILGKTQLSGSLLAEISNQTGATNSILEGDVSLSATSKYGTARVIATGAVVTFGGAVSIKGGVATEVIFSTTSLSEVKGKFSLTGGDLGNTFKVKAPLQFDKDVNLNFKNGQATLEIDADFLENLTISSGAGSDSFRLAGVTVGGATKLSSGAGADSVFFDRDTYTGAVTMNLGDGDDDLTMCPNPNESASVYFQARSSFLMGKGNDEMILGFASGGIATTTVSFAAGAAGSKFDGGLGLNLFDDTKARVTGLILATDFLFWTRTAP